MIIEEEYLEQLKQHLITILEPICDADPETLADYVIALLNNDIPNKDLMNLCISQLEDFLNAETENFVNQLFNIVETKSYLPEFSANNNTQEQQSDLKRSREESQEQKEDSDQSDDDRNFKHKRAAKDSRSSSVTRKSEYEEQTQPPNKKYRADNKSNNKTLNKDQNDNNRYQNNKNSQEKDTSNSNSDNKLGKRRRNENENDNSKGKYMRSNNDLNNDGKNNYKNNNYHQNQQMNNNNMKHMNNQKSYQNMNQDFNYMNNMNPNNGNMWYNQNNQNIQMMQNNQNRFRGRNQQFRNPNNNGIHPRQRCIDYDEKGYCLRGDMCPFDHGMDRIVVDEMTSSNRRNFDNMLNNNIPPRMMPSMNQNNFNNQFMNNNNIFENDNSYLNTEGYDPEQPSYNSNLGPTQWGNSVMDPIENSFQNNFNNNNNNNNNTNNNSKVQNEDQNQLNQNNGNNDNIKQNTSSQSTTSNIRGRGGRGRGRGRGAFGYNRHRQSSVKQPILNIENIPVEYFAIDKINNYFKKFGTIININLNPRHYKATIQFSQYNEANQAYNSPDPIFGNRFVKLYWAKIESEDNENSTQNENDANVTSSSNSKPAEEEKPEAPQLSSEEMDQINKMKKSMISKQLEKQKAFMKQVENPALTKPEKEEILNNIKLITESVKHIMNASPQHIKVLAGNILQQPKENTKSETSTDGSKPNDGTLSETSKLSAEEQSLKEKVESLKAEAASLGIDPSSITSTTTPPSTAIPIRGRGGYRARGRGLHPWGRGGRSFKLDNRPTKLLIKGFSKENQAAVQQNFELFGVVENYYVSKDGLSAIVHYQTRREAEQAFSYGKKIEGINDTLELSWFTETPDPNLYDVPAQTNTTSGTSNAVAEALAQLANKINKINNSDNKIAANLSSTLESLNKSTNESNNDNEGKDNKNSI